MAKSKSRNFFVWIIMGLLFFGLIGFGASGLSGTIRTVGEVGNKPISTSDYGNELSNRIRAFSAQVGRPINFAEAESIGLPQQALAAVVARRTLDNETAVMGLSVGDAAITERVLAVPAFRGSDGTFDRAEYRAALAQSGLSVRDYETGLREDTARGLLEAAVFTGLPTAQIFGDTVAAHTREGRTFTWATLTADDIDVTLAEPTEDDLRAHYDANPTRYTSPETRVVRYVWITPGMIADTMQVSEDELQEEYQNRLSEFVQPERRLVERLAFSTQDDAAEALAAIEAGDTTFPALVEDRGLSLDAIDIGDVTEDELGDAGAAVFALETGGVAGPFPSDLGPALFRMNAILAPREVTFEQALPDLREDQAILRAQRFINDQSETYNDLIAGGTPLETVAEQTDLEFATLDWSEDVTEGIAAYSAFRETVAGTVTGNFPQLLALDDGGAFAFQVVEIRPPALIPLDDVRDQVIDGWEETANAQAVLDEAETLRAQLSEAAPDFAAAGLDAVQDTNRTRRDFIAGTPPAFMEIVFDMEVGELRAVESGRNAIVVRLDDIVAADTENDAFVAEQASLSELGGDGMARDLFEMFARQVQIRTDVDVNQQALNAVHTNFR